MQFRPFRVPLNNPIPPRLDAYPPCPCPCPEPDRRFDRVSAGMALVTSVALAWLIVVSFGGETRRDPPAVGSQPPPLLLKDPASGEPTLLGRRGQVVWIAFWSARSHSGRADLARLDRVWARLRGYSHFSMIAAAIDSEHPQHVRSTRTAAGVRLPVYLATPATCRAFGAGDGPLQVLLDEHGRVAAVARGADPGTLDRLARRAEWWLDALEPPSLGNLRFAVGPTFPRSILSP